MIDKDKLEIAAEIGKVKKMAADHLREVTAGIFMRDGVPLDKVDEVMKAANDSMPAHCTECGDGFFADGDSSKCFFCWELEKINE
jgi:hypothetical protein